MGTKFLFFMYASFIAPFHFKPKRCPMDGNNCPIWNCKYHYDGFELNGLKYCRNARYAEKCQRERF